MTEEEAKKIVNSMNFRHEMNTVISVLQDVETKEILMVGNMNREALYLTLTTGKTHFWSLTRKTIWMKGETSGHYQIVEDVLIDCDEDAVVVKVRPEGPTCHTGNKSCFYRSFKVFLANQ
ncbi:MULTISPECIES: phosphoribosyl-AMP cyclohydrolase [Acidianus]|uniref:Phosphoribosyl-AMP cyclohydrolase n=1 Tax=Candidatus Acidianus copahuensis TaxID=1160895 RepID=A0A031LV72_9CREN|nr:MULTISPECIES: phosphoribosyl-AMP cyclohydrolase [Acidianus]EZQ11033.1 phosphoribosyl-AMP cyclohydrolase [Candidatus Acidianus copahuensis]NON62608.1 phosphoribosyl-AMP cyclohydrolase [Acidianus sp. RZ1]